MTFQRQFLSDNVLSSRHVFSTLEREDFANYSSPNSRRSSVTSSSGIPALGYLPRRASTTSFLELSGINQKLAFLRSAPNSRRNSVKSNCACGSYETGSSPWSRRNSTTSLNSEKLTNSGRKCVQKLSPEEVSMFVQVFKNIK
jgi:hypothetical protein